jgi:hypothetical protein
MPADAPAFGCGCSRPCRTRLVRVRVVGMDFEPAALADGASSPTLRGARARAVGAEGPLAGIRRPISCRAGCGAPTRPGTARRQGRRAPRRTGCRQQTDARVAVCAVGDGRWFVPLRARQHGPLRDLGRPFSWGMARPPSSPTHGRLPHRQLADAGDVGPERAARRVLLLVEPRECRHRTRGQLTFVVGRFGRLDPPSLGSEDEYGALGSRFSMSRGPPNSPEQPSEPSDDRCHSGRPP